MNWLAQYKREWLPGDIVAGVTLAAYAIPVSLAYAALPACRRRSAFTAICWAGLAMRCSARRGNWRSGPRLPSL